jgi:dTDP-4-dehydrorhamnose 3,5-epimerase-like enzyme
MVMTIMGDISIDHRGTLRFVNDFGFKGIKRFYTITHPKTSTIRAWRGHKIETKYFYAVKGSFLINWIHIDNWEQPSDNLHIHARVLSDKKSEILKVSPGYVNGLKALQPDSIIIIFSDMNMADSKKDDYRFPADSWQMKYS